MLTTPAHARTLAALLVAAVLVAGTLSGCSQKTASPGGAAAPGGATKQADATASFTTHCYLIDVEGPEAGPWTVVLDPFDVYDGKEAESYARANGMDVPANGILFVDPSTDTSTYPLADGATITAWSGELMSPKYFEMTPGQLRALVKGEETTGTPSVWQNVWQAVVTKGRITKLTLVVIAD